MHLNQTLGMLLRGVGNLKVVNVSNTRCNVKVDKVIYKAKAKAKRIRMLRFTMGGGGGGGGGGRYPGILNKIKCPPCQLVSKVLMLLISKLDSSLDSRSCFYYLFCFLPFTPSLFFSLLARIKGIVSIM